MACLHSEGIDHHPVQCHLLQPELVSEQHLQILLMELLGTQTRQSPVNILRQPGTHNLTSQYSQLQLLTLPFNHYTTIFLWGKSFGIKY